MKTSSNETITVLCYGNPARGDDGLGPALARRLEDLEVANVHVEQDYQLMVEDAAVIADSSFVVFADAAVAGDGPFSFHRLAERNDIGYMAHTIDPERLLGLTRETFGRCPPAYALAIRGYSFDMFDEGLSTRAKKNLDEAFHFLEGLLTGENGEIDRLRAGGVSHASQRPSQQSVSTPGNAPQEA